MRSRPSHSASISSRARAASSVRSRLDARLSFIGALVDGALTFTVPPLASGSYSGWCSGCRPSTPLRLTMPPATSDSCPATLPNGDGPPPGLVPSPRWHGNGFLWTSLPADGVFAPGSGLPADPVAPDGSIWTKLFWFAAHVDGPLKVSGQRLDAASPALRVERVNRGSATGFTGSATWATPVSFPSAGCWKITARVNDVSLSFIVRVTSG